MKSQSAEIFNDILGAADWNLKLVHGGYNFFPLFSLIITIRKIISISYAQRKYENQVQTHTI